MLKKKKCGKCGEGTKDSFEFCPSCGDRLKNSDENFGMLGRNDSVPGRNEIRLPMGLNTIFNSLLKTLNQEFNQLNKDMNNQPTFKSKPNSKGLSISISTSPNQKPQIRVDEFGKKQKKEKAETVIILPENELKKFKELKQEEPETTIRRLADSIIYEIKLPGVKSEKDLSIKKVGESIEIRAISKNKAYLKTITINLPITNYEFSKSNLILELEAKN